MFWSLAKLPDGIAAAATILFGQAACGDLSLILAPEAYDLDAPRVTSQVERQQKARWSPYQGA